jgi:hypothetical protein
LRDRGEMGARDGVVSRGGHRALMAVAAVGWGCGGHRGGEGVGLGSCGGGGERITGAEGRG